MIAYNRFADIYDNLITEDVDYLAWSNFVKSIFNKNGGNREDYLDIGCGTGNLSINIAPDFKKTWCVDLSEEMLINAERKFRDNRQKARFVQQDMTELQLNNKFDLITCSLDCTNYLINDGDLDKFFTAVFSHLKHNGTFIFDINSEHKLRNILGNNTFTYNTEDIVYLWDNNIEDNLIEMYLTFFIKDSEKYERFDEVHNERIYSEKEIESSIENSGLHIIGKVDNYTNTSVNKFTERITYIISKI